MMNTNKYALVTGASRGIGRAIARELAASGYHLFLTCHTQQDALNQLCDELTKTYGTRCIAYSLDVGDCVQVEELYRTYLTLFPKLDLLVNNAGISMVGLLTEMCDEDWNQMIATNLSSVFYMSKRAIPLMLQERTGSIINISSVWGSAGASCEVAYSAAKGGVNSFTKALAKELAPNGIRVNALACGLIDTSMNAHLSAEELSQLCEEIPMGRAGDVKEAARLVAMLASSPDYLTGQVITLDGGWI